MNLCVRLGLVFMLLALGCKTYRSQRLYNDCCEFRGIPTQVYKLHLVSVTWEEGPARPNMAGDGIQEAEGQKTPEADEPSPQSNIRRFESIKTVAYEQPTIFEESAPVIHEPATVVGTVTANEAFVGQVRTTTHLCRLPVTYAVDTVGACIGTDESEFTFDGGGSLSKAMHKRDQKIAELVASLGETAGAFAPKGETRLDGANPYDFYPKLPENAIVRSIDVISEFR